MHRSRLRYVIGFVVHLLFWAAVYYALKALTTTSINMVMRVGDNREQRIAVQALFPYRWIVLGFLMLFFYGNSLLLLKRMMRIERRALRVAVEGAWFALVFAADYVTVRLCIGPAAAGLPVPFHANFRSLPPSIGPTVPLSPGPIVRELSSDSWLHLQLIVGVVFLSVLAVAIAQFFIKEWIRNDLRRSQAEAQQLSTEIRFLRSQVNPHFLFNTLNNLFSMAQKKGNDDLADSISRLSGMMRYMLYESDTGEVPLQKEIDYLQDCIALHKLRYADSEVAVTFQHPPPAAIADVRVAPMLFTAFLENAFKHGVSIGRTSRIVVAIAVEAGKLCFTCENTDYSGVRKPEDEKSGIGLVNVRRRLELLYGGRYQLQAAAADGKYSVHLQIDVA